MKYTVLGQQQIPKNKNVIEDCGIGLCQSSHYPVPLRLVTVADPQNGERISFLTNHFTLDSETIAELYKSRWEIEIFFKWIKQNLKIKSFLGTSKNAVMTQVWTAMIYYLLLSFIKFQTKCRHSLHELTKIVGELLLDTVNLIDTLTITYDEFKIVTFREAQLSLF